MSEFKVSDFIRSNSTTLLSIAATVGVVITTVLAVKATPKAEAKIRDIPKKADEEPSKKEIVKATWQVYIPTVLVGTATIGCIIGSNSLSRKQQAALAGAYVVLAKNYKRYKDQVIQFFGEEADEKVKDAIAKEEVKDVKPSSSSSTCLFYEEHYGEIFERSMLEVLSAELEMNRRFVTNGEVPLNDFFDLLALDHRIESEDLGWGQEDVFDACQCCWLNFEHHLTVTDDGMEVYTISVETPPTTNYSQIPPWFDN